MFECEPPPFNRRYLESRLAYRIQELSLGGCESVEHPFGSIAQLACNMRRAIALVGIPKPIEAVRV